MSRYLVLVVAVVGCAGDEDTMMMSEPYGTYQAQRVITNWEPSPDFEIPLTETVTITATSVETSNGQIVQPPHRAGSRWTVMTSEQWPSREGTGVATLTYTLDVPGDGTLTGSIGAKVIFDAPTIHTDFDYALAVEGTR